ncbi:MAG: hypothetical protein BGO12_23835 [Verrucomicrobia bacterium 61-8]|nr:MAG: hypothetical protein BGO12_23835 [Verrucomicrobia bacterium 61-8]
MRKIGEGAILAIKGREIDLRFFSRQLDRQSDNAKLPFFGALASLGLTQIFAPFHHATTARRTVSG